MGSNESKYSLHGRRAFKILDTALSDNCCLRCDFCYIHGGRGKPYDRALQDAQYDWFLGQYLANPHKEDEKTLWVNILGGEPLVEWDNLVREIPQRKEEAKSRGLNLRFTIVSNLALLTKERADWCIDNKVGVSCSIDGCAEAQDTHRRFEDGSGSSHLVFPNAKYLVERSGVKTVRMTITPKTVKWYYESFLKMTELGFQEVNAVLASGVEWDDESLALYKAGLLKTMDWMMEQCRAGKWYAHFVLNKTLPHIWGKSRDTGRCGAASSMVCVDPSGNMWPCHRFSGGDPSHKLWLGRLETGVTNFDAIDRIAHYNTSLLDFGGCSRCPHSWACQGKCCNVMSQIGRVTPQICKIQGIHALAAQYFHTHMVAEAIPLYKTHMSAKTPGIMPGEEINPLYAAHREKARLEKAIEKCPVPLDGYPSFIQECADVAPANAFDIPSFESV